VMWVLQLLQWFYTTSMWWPNGWWSSYRSYKGFMGFLRWSQWVVELLWILSWVYKGSIAP